MARHVIRFSNRFTTLLEAPTAKIDHNSNIIKYYLDSIHRTLRLPIMFVMKSSKSSVWVSSQEDVTDNFPVDRRSGKQSDTRVFIVGGNWNSGCGAWRLMDSFVRAGNPPPERTESSGVAHSSNGKVTGVLGFGNSARANSFKWF